MSYDSTEKSGALSKPYELYLFQGLGVDIAVTSGDLARDYFAHTFEPATIKRTEIDVSSEVTNGQIKVYVPPGSPIAELFVGYLPTSQIALTVFAGHEGDTETVVLFSGYVASSRFTDQTELVCNSDQYKLQTKIPRIMYQAPCPHIFGDPFCGVALSTVTYAGVVGAISADGTQVTVTAFASLPHSLKAGFLRRGNDLRMIVDQTGDVVTLLTAIAGLAIGDEVQGTAGCQGTFSDCVSFNNWANFMGFDLIPLLNPFDGSIT
jgi:hypothetical protein